MAPPAGFVSLMVTSLLGSNGYEILTPRKPPFSFSFSYDLVAVVGYEIHPPRGPPCGYGLVAVVGYVLVGPE